MWDITAEGARRAPGTENAEKISVKGLYLKVEVSRLLEGSLCRLFFSMSQLLQFNCSLNFQAMLGDHFSPNRPTR